MSDINPRDFGAMEAKVELLEKKMDDMAADMKELLGIVQQAKGGWKTLVMVGTAAGAVGAAVAKAASWIQVVPK